MITKFCYSFKFIHSKSESLDFCSSLFYVQYRQIGNFYIFGINNNRTCTSQILKVVSLFGEKFNFFSPLEFEAKSKFDHRTYKIKSHSARVSKQYLNNKSDSFSRNGSLFFYLVQRILNHTLDIAVTSSKPDYKSHLSYIVIQSLMICLQRIMNLR